MELSLFLAKVIGLTLMLVSTSLIVNKKNIDLLFEVYSHPKAVFITGVFETILGLSFVLSHNIWTFDFQGIITFIGWMLLLRGVGRTLFPESIVKTLEKFRRMRSIMVPLLIFIFLVGAYLAFMGFTG